MKKRYLLGVLGTVIGLGILPYYCGHLIKKTFEEAVLVLNEDEHLTATVTAYKQGWFSSSAATELVATGSAYDGPMQMTFTHEIQHGPLLHTDAASKVAWQLGQGYVRSKMHTFDERLVPQSSDDEGKDLFSLSMLVPLSGLLQINLNSQPFHLSDTSGIDIDWQGLEGQVTVSADYKQTEGEVIVPGVDLIIDDNEVQLADMVCTFDQQLGEAPFEQLWLGDLTLNARYLNVLSQGQQQPFSLTSVRLKGATTPSAAHLTLTANIDIDAIAFGDERYGPLNQSIEWQRVSPDALRLIQDMSHEAKDNPAMGHLILLEKMSALSKAFLSPRPALVMPDFQLKTPNGVLKAMLHAEIGGENAYDWTAPHKILASLTGTFELMSPEQLVHDRLADYLARHFNAAAQTQAVIEKGIAAGYIVKHADGYLFKFTVEGSQVALNGQLLRIANGQALQAMVQSLITEVPPQTEGVSPPSVPLQ